MNWTDERVERLKKLWADGLSASQIAAQLGGVSRNAVIGKVHRLNLPGRAKSGGQASVRTKRTTAAPRAPNYAGRTASQTRPEP
jgi:GcrA cell cycle regulator